MGTRNRCRAAWVAPLVAVLAACGGTQRPAPSASAVALPTMTVEPQRTPTERRLDGVIQAVNQGTIAAQTSGRVAEILYDVNDFVPAGAVLMRLRSTEQRAGLAQAEAVLSEASAREAEAQLRYGRIAAMYGRRVVARAALDEATADRDAALGRLNAARAAVASAQEGVSYTEIRAPYAGVVAKRLVQVGETVSPGTPLIIALSLQYLRVEVDIPQSIVDQVRRVKKAAIYIDGRRIESTRVTVFPEASTPSSTFRTRLELPENATDLYPGMFVKAGFVIGVRERLLIPAAALVRRGEVTAVYMLDPGGQLSMRQVRVGERFDDSIEVLSGVVAGERVVTDPQAALKTLALLDGAGNGGP